MHFLLFLTFSFLVADSALSASQPFDTQVLTAGILPDGTLGKKEITFRSNLETRISLCTNAMNHQEYGKAVEYEMITLSALKEANLPVPVAGSHMRLAMAFVAQGEILKAREHFFTFVDLNQNAQQDDLTRETNLRKAILNVYSFDKSDRKTGVLRILMDGAGNFSGTSPTFKINPFWAQERFSGPYLCVYCQYLP